jgi:iron complex outermembrane receptor protein
MLTLQNQVFSSRTGKCSFLLIFLSASLTFAQQKPGTGRIISEPKDSIINVKVVDFGYGIQKQTEVTGSITGIRSGEFNKGHIDRPEQLIQGKVTGLDISKPGGDPNGSYYLRLRGLSTIYANTQPLFVIDGIPDASIYNVDPNDIESITVLKDGASSSLYGLRGSNGVILVTTRKGERATSVIDYNVYVSAEMVGRNTPMMNSAEWRTLNTALGGLGTDFGGNTNWLKEIEQTALSQVHNLSLSGGSDKTSYRASFNFRQGEGVEIETGYSQVNGRINLSQKALNDKLTLVANLAATERKSKYGFAEAFHYASIFNPTAPVMSDAQGYDQYDHYFNQVLFDYYNPVQILKTY